MRGASWVTDANLDAVSGVVAAVFVTVVAMWWHNNESQNMRVGVVDAVEVG
jgi:hypothetical protein